MRGRLFGTIVSVVLATSVPAAASAAPVAAAPHASAATPNAVVAAAPTCPAFTTSGLDLVRSAGQPTAGTCQPLVDFPNAFTAPPRTITTVDLDATAGYRTSSLWATYGDTLHRLVLRTSWETGTDVRTVKDTAHGLGWQSIRLLAASEWNGYLYGVHDNGRLYRYTSTSGIVRSAGSQSGFGAVRTLTLIGEHADRDVLLVTLATGQLSVVRVPRTPTMTATSSQIRSRSWQGFTALTYRDSGRAGQPNILSALNPTSNRWYTYSMADATRGLATPMTAVGDLAAGQVTAPATNTTTGFPLTGG